MERELVRKKPNKRKLVERYYDDDDDMDKVYRFRILLPNGTSVKLTLPDPDPEMSFGDFIELVKDEYFLALKQSESMKQKRTINWKDGSLCLVDANDIKIRDTVKFKKFHHHKCHILRLHDGSSEIADKFENMWDLTPDTDLLKELPEEYTFETALADLIDNSLQAVWSNGKSERRLIRVDLDKERISIFDTGSGMDGSNENSIVKWGKMGASLHRSSKTKAIGLEPPYLRPFFGMFGYGGSIASMHLGRNALVSSKTAHTKKVYKLHLEREALLSSSSSGHTWQTDGGIRNPLADEIRDSPHGSFTKVEIFRPKIKDVDLLKIQCNLKDIYFPYIQCDDISDAGKTIKPIEFQVNGVDLAEIEGGEVAITNLHSCNGPEFVLQLRFSLKHQKSATKGPCSRTFQEANACMKCVYFPVKEGKESIERILERLKADGCGITENFETFSRVSVRRLGRLLPDARWSSLPFMEFRHKRGNKAHTLKRCCMRVKCFIETDGGFNPTPSKTDLAHHNPFTTALKNFGNKISDKERDISVEIRKAGKLLTPLQLESEYQEWIRQMHAHYDEETDSGEDQPVIIVSPANKKALGISSDVIRVHQVLKRKEISWQRGHKIKVLKGACAGFHKNNVYATIEYFLLEGFRGDAGGDARIICRPINIPDENGCVLSVNYEDASLDMNSSLSLPVTVIDSGKCLAVESIEWEYQLDKQRQKSPSTIDLLDEKNCLQLEVNGALPVGAPIHAGQDPPREIVAVIRPANFTSSGPPKNLDQRYIVKSSLEMLMEMKFMNEGKDRQEAAHRYSCRVTPSSCKAFHGLYVFPLGCKFPDLFKRAGVYLFSFSLNVSSCQSCEEKVIVKPSPSIGKWALLSDKQSPSYNVRVGSCFPPFTIACYDVYGNRIRFTSIPKVTIKLLNDKDFLVEINKMKMGLSRNKMILNIEDVLIESGELDRLRPSYRAKLVISSPDDLFSISIPCQVIPGFIHHVEIQPLMLPNQLVPGYVIEELMLEMFDDYGNHVPKDLEVALTVVGFMIQDHTGLKFKVDDYGRINLSGLLKVTAGYGGNASLSIFAKNKIVFKQEIQTVKRELRIASKVPDSCSANGQLENIIIEVVDPDGNIDVNIHHEEKCGRSHMLTIKSECYQTEDSIRYTFKHGRCVVPSIPVPVNEGIFCFEAAHSSQPELLLLVKVPVIKAPKIEYSDNQSPFSEKSLLLLQNSPSFKQEGNLMVSFVNNEKELEDSICRTGERIGKVEKELNRLYIEKEKIEQKISTLQATLEPNLSSKENYLSTKEELMKRIEGMDNTVAAVLWRLHKSPTPMSQNSFKDDVVGLVALLGTVRTHKLSRILAEYLGEDKMLAVICRTFAAAGAFEKYKQNGEVDKGLALHAEAAALGKAINCRFLVICLEDLRPYRGGCEGSDPQGKLALPNPTLPDGNTPVGFLGYAVNMIDLDVHHLGTQAASGYGLRETVLFSLFRKLHVYETRFHMMAACACVEDGAVSLDGGILRESGIISLGYGNPEICFPLKLPSAERETMMQIEEQKSSLRRVIDVIGKLNKSREKDLKKFKKRSSKYRKLMDNMKPVFRS
ncbi:Protein defective in meristem silencing 3 [Quillaja saponaria]|uniref:Protein defective in meristem silencing 3 n=1 Tax=Quillaja saponaria TaxID=32244 RepID=A0AAD7PRK5_QUISA|nr:Protein defective in meristem silencing 3 [Quillaja saponaria]